MITTLRLRHMFLQFVNKILVLAASFIGMWSTLQVSRSIDKFVIRSSPMAASAIRCLRLLALGLIFSVLRYVLDNYLKLQGHKNIFQIIIDDDNLYILPSPPIN